MKSKAPMKLDLEYGHPSHEEQVREVQSMYDSADKHPHKEDWLFICSIEAEDVFRKVWSTTLALTSESFIKELAASLKREKKLQKENKHLRQEKNQYVKCRKVKS